MPSLLKKLQYLYQCYFPNYEFSMNNVELMDEAYQLLNAVFIEELGRETKDNEDRPSPAQYTDVGIVTNKSKKVVAALESFKAPSIANNESKLKAYGIQQIPHDLWPRTICHSHLAVLQGYRDSWMGLHLLRHCYDYYIHQGMLISVAYCIPKLYSLYAAFGYKITSPPVNTIFGCRIPIALITFDKDHQKHKKSPFYKNCHAFSNWQISDKEQQLIKAFQQQTSAAENYISLNNTKTKSAISFPIWEGISQKAHEFLLKNAVWLKCPLGLQLIKQGGGGFDMGIVVSGTCKVVENDKEIATIKPGAIFGEMAFQTKGARTADVIINEEDTEVVLFSLSILKRMQADEDAVKLKTLIQNTINQRQGR